MLMVTVCRPPDGIPSVTAAAVGAVMLRAVQPPRSEPYSKTCVVSLADSSRRVKVKTKFVPEASRVGKDDGVGGAGIAVEDVFEEVFHAIVVGVAGGMLSAGAGEGGSRSIWQSR